MQIIEAGNVAEQERAEIEATYTSSVIDIMSNLDISLESTSPNLWARMQAAKTTGGANAGNDNLLEHAVEDGHESD